MLEHIQNDKFGIGSVDFNKIIPMPKSLNIEAGSRTDRGLLTYRDFVSVYLLDKVGTDVDLLNIPIESEQAFLRKRTDVKPDEWELGKTAYQNIQRYKAPTWYEWCTENWGTKWGAYGYESGTDYSGSNPLRFQTAWSAPHPVIRKLAEMYPDIEISHEWADEDIGQNCGRFEYREGERYDEYYPERNKDRIEFAARVMKVDLRDYGLYLNAAETGYIRLNEEEYHLIELFGKPAMFTNDRITDEDIPHGLHCYHLRETDDSTRFASLEPRVRANHGGSVIIDEPIEFGDHGFIPLNEDSEPNFTGEEITVNEYMNGEFDLADDKSEKMEGLTL